MTRIIGGIAGSRTLISPAKSTRPTSDRIRESIFSRLDALNLIEESRVLDLYAGTGALGLEAASRGAERVVFVENNKQALGGIIQNFRMVKTALQKENLDCDFQAVGKTVLSFLGSQSESFDLVFIDPPYELSNDSVTDVLEQLLAFLEPNATIVLERSSRDQQPKIPSALSLSEAKNYGDTVVYWLNN
ncbi:MAG: 16S rRNA (guanine(966)-N(2))-methyltransferase RsmD [Rhodoluna sp.]